MTHWKFWDEIISRRNNKTVRKIIFHELAEFWEFLFTNFIGRIDHQKDVPHFIISDIWLQKWQIEAKKSKGKTVKITPIHSRFSNDYI